MNEVLIWSNEHERWWMPNGNGYTKDKREAGLYSLGQALEILDKANWDRSPEAKPNETLVPAVWKEVE